MMAFRQQQQQQQRCFVVDNGTADGTGAFEDNTIPKKRKLPLEGPSWEAEIHHFEKEAYTAVVRAFKIQSDSISWDKESLMTKLRQELRLTNDEHREILGVITTENCYQRIRELRQASGDKYNGISSSNMSYNAQPHDIDKGPSRKLSKMHSTGSHLSIDLPSTFNQQSSYAVGRKLLIVQNHANVVKGSTNLVQHPSSSSNEMGTNGINVSKTILERKNSELAKHTYLLGKKVKTRLPNYHSLYDAVINRYNTGQGLHALSFNLASGKDNLKQWVNPSKWDNESPELTTLPHSFRLRCNSRTGGGMFIRKSKLKSDFFKVPGDSVHGASGIKIRVTDDLLETVNRVFRAGKVDSNIIGYAKEALKEHEKALILVLKSLADVSDDE